MSIDRVLAVVATLFYFPSHFHDAETDTVIRPVVFNDKPLPQVIPPLAQLREPRIRVPYVMHHGQTARAHQWGIHAPIRHDASERVISVNVKHVNRAPAKLPDNPLKRSLSVAVAKMHVRPVNVLRRHGGARRRVVTVRQPARQGDSVNVAYGKLLPHVQRATLSAPD